MFIIEGVTRSPSYVAEQVHLHWVQGDSKDFFKLEDLHLPENKSDLFFSRIHLLCEAASLRVLLTEAEDDKRFQGVVHEFEHLILPPVPSPEGVTKLEELKATMEKLQELFTEENKELVWCRHWFEGIDHYETNPRSSCYLRGLLESIRPRSDS